MIVERSIYENGMNVECYVLHTRPGSPKKTFGRVIIPNYPKIIWGISISSQCEDGKSKYMKGGNAFFSSSTSPLPFVLLDPYPQAQECS